MLGVLAFSFHGAVRMGSGADRGTKIWSDAPVGEALSTLGAGWSGVFAAAEEKAQTAWVFFERRCSCKAHGNQTCIVCRLTPYLSENLKLGDGDRLTVVSLTRFLALIRAALAVAGVQRAAEAALKMFRAGHATTMAAAGESLGAMLLDDE